jgi:hypothetical protein
MPPRSGAMTARPFPQYPAAEDKVTSAEPVLRGSAPAPQNFHRIDVTLRAERAWSALPDTLSPSGRTTYVIYRIAWLQIGGTTRPASLRWRRKIPGLLE